MVDLNISLVNKSVCKDSDYKEAVEYLKEASKCGVKKAVITFPYSKGGENLDSKEIVKRMEKLKGSLDKNDIKISVYNGQVVKLGRDVIYDCLDGVVSTVNGTKYMMVDLDESMSDDKVDLVFELTLKGIVPIIVHPERYEEIIEKPSRIEKLKEIGCLFQLDINSLDSKYGSDVKNTAKKLLRKDQYQFVASESNVKSKDTIKKIKSLLSKGNQDNFRKNGMKMIRDEEVEASKVSMAEKKFIFI